MELQKLKKEDFTQDIVRGEPMIKFQQSGLITINKSGVKHLKLNNSKKMPVCVSLMCDPRHPYDFFITTDNEGWPLRGINKNDPSGPLALNNVALAKHVIDQTWQHCKSPVGEVKPKSYCFSIAMLPVDDNENKNVFALIRKKV